MRTQLEYGVARARMADEATAAVAEASAPPLSASRSPDADADTEDEDAGAAVARSEAQGPVTASLARAMTQGLRAFAMATAFKGTLGLLFSVVRVAGGGGKRGSKSESEGGGSAGSSAGAAAVVVGASATRMSRRGFRAVVDGGAAEGPRPWVVDVGGLLPAAWVTSVRKVWSKFDAKDVLQFGLFVGLSIGTFRGTLALLRRRSYLADLDDEARQAERRAKGKTGAAGGVGEAGWVSVESRAGEGEVRGGGGAGGAGGDAGGRGLEESVEARIEAGIDASDFVVGADMGGRGHAAVALERTLSRDWKHRAVAGALGALLLCVDGTQRRQTIALYAFSQAFDTVRKMMEGRGLIRQSWMIDAGLFGLCNGPIMYVRRHEEAPRWIET